MNRLAKIVLPLAALVLAPLPGGAEPVRTSFDILTGSAAGNYFPVGELIARVISHPQGLGRCERQAVCAPPGIIVSARTSGGAVANVMAVNSGAAASGLAQAPVLAEAVKGQGPFRKAGPQKHIRVMADLFAEPVQLVVGSKIAGLSALRGKKIAVGNPGSGDDAIATAILGASGVRAGRIIREGPDTAAGQFAAGKLDAFFFLGEAPAPAIADLVTRGDAKLLPLGGAMRVKLLVRIAGLEAATIPAGSYRGVGTIETVSARTLWIANDAAPASTVYGIVRALFDPANRPVLTQGFRPAPEIRLGGSAAAGTVPVHPGAMQFYREAGMLPPARPPH